MENQRENMRRSRIDLTYNRVDESHDEYRVAQIGNHLSAFRNRSSHNGGKCRSESKLKEPKLIGNIIIHEEEVSVSYERLWGTLNFATIGEGISNGPECQSTTSTVQQVPKDNVLGVLRANRPSTNHGKARLHKVNESSGKDEEEGVNSRCETLNPFIEVLVKKWKRRLM
jgi:hypothetical protein